ncbi:non-ribosomal peptide synthetase [Actinophytocola sp.]|uniref:non-ribosomal peptide synthetase n=1 Tax=Actinophytocola sp. TaxID=1872138 RepID=UPI003899E14B
MAAPETATRKEEALWLLEKLLPDTGVNNLSFTFRVAGRLRPAAVRDAMRLLLRRYEVLRTTFLGTAAGLTRQVLAEVEVEVRTGRLPADPTAMRADLAAFVAEPFRFDGAPVLRVGHFSAPDGDVVCLTVHHLIFDTISGGILLGELVAAYDAFAAGGAAPAELTGTVPALREAEPSTAGVEYWRERLRGFQPDRLDLWCGRQDAAGATLAGDQVTVGLSAPAREVVRRLRTELNTSEAVILLAAYNVLLAAHGAGPDLAVGTMVNTRGRRHERAVGYHVNVVPLRGEVDLDQDFRTLVERASSAFLEAIAHADVPVDNLYAEVARDGGSWRNTLFRHVFNYVPGVDLGEFTIGGLTATPLVVEIPYSKFDLEFFVLSGAADIRLRAVFSTDVFTRDQVHALLARYDRLLVSLGADTRRPVRDVRLWSEHDHAVIDAANDTTADAGPGTVVDAVRRRVAESPDAVAVESGEVTVTYRRLWAAACAVRRMLADAGVAAGHVVALGARRSPDLAAAALGVWLAGAVYLPLDPDHPPHRIAHQLADSGAVAVLVDAGSRLRTRDGVTRLELPAPVSSTVDDSVVVPAAGDPAYLIYTSGSTGRPKGTLVAHGSVANLVEHFRAELGATTDAVAWLTTFSFDISALELFLPLVCGGRVVVAPDEARVDGRVLADLVGRHRVDIVQATPTTWRLVLPECAEVLSGLRVLCGGEPLSPALAHRLAATGCELRNVYGPTETTIWSTSGVIGKDDDVIRVGRPIRNTTVFVAAPDGRELPVGVRGELCVAGAGVAVGYHNRADLTGQRFGVHPRHGRFYRTGDVAQWCPDGTVEVLGRADRQVKLRGNRVELGEVERVLLDHPAVRAAAVVVVGEDAAAALVAFVVAEDRPEIVNHLWEHARRALPAAAVPSEFVRLAELPTTGNHKVDHLALLRVLDERAASRPDAHRPGPNDPDGPDELTAGLVRLWREVLRRDDLTAQSNFFTSGGQSLTAAMLMQRIEEELGPRLELAELFTRPTPAELADFLRLGTPAGTLVEEVR